MKIARIAKAASPMRQEPASSNLILFFTTTTAAKHLLRSPKKWKCTWCTQSVLIFTILIATISRKTAKKPEKYADWVDHSELEQRKIG